MLPQVPKLAESEWCVISQNTFITVVDETSDFVINTQSTRKRVRLHSDSSAAQSKSPVSWVNALHCIDSQSKCAPWNALKDQTHTPPDTSSSEGCHLEFSRRRSSRQAKQACKLSVGTFIGVTFSACTRAQCSVQSVKSGASYQKCHCEIKQSTGTQVLIHHVAESNMADVWLDQSDARLVISKDERWCRHGRLCNKSVRGRTCKNGSDCRFCHDPACVAALKKAIVGEKQA